MEAIAADHEIQKIERAAEPLIETAKAFKVVDDTSFEDAGRFVVDIKEKIKTIVAFFKPMKDAAHRAHKEVCNKESDVLGRYEQAIAIVNRPLIEYREVQERKRRAEEARLLAIQRKEEEDARLQEAAELEKAQEFEAAEQIINEPIVVTPPVLPAATPQVKGMGMQPYWWGEMVNKLAFVEAVAEGKVPLAALEINEGYINKEANARKGNLQWPGVIIRRGTRVKGTGRR